MLGVGPPQRNQRYDVPLKSQMQFLLTITQLSGSRPIFVGNMRWLTHIYFAPCLTIESKFQILSSKSTMEHPVFIQLIPSNNSGYFYWEWGVSIATLVHWMEVLALACPDAWSCCAGFHANCRVSRCCASSHVKDWFHVPQDWMVCGKKTTIHGDIMGMRRIYIYNLYNILQP